MKNLFNIISRKKEALKEETNQKDKVKNKRTEYIKSKVMEIYLLRNEKVIDTQRIWEAIKFLSILFSERHFFLFL